MFPAVPQLAALSFLPPTTPNTTTTSSDIMNPTISSMFQTLTEKPTGFNGPVDLSGRLDNNILHHVYSVCLRHGQCEFALRQQEQHALLVANHV